MGDLGKGKIEIFIPAYNEGRSIGSVVLLAKEYGAVHVIDDGSKDNTAEVARLAGAQVTRRSQNGGYGAAMIDALEIAKKGEAAAVVIMDGDFQHDPHEIPKIVKPILEGKADVCLGSRFSGSFVNAPTYRKEGVMFINWLTGVQSGKGKIDYQSGYRAFNKTALEKIKIKQNGYSAGYEALLSAQEQGLRICEVPANVRYYDGGKRGAIAQASELVGQIVKTILKRKPLVFFTLSGLLVLLASGLLGAYVVDTFNVKRILPIGLALLTVFGGVSGLILILIGINLYTINLLERKQGK